MGPGRRDPKRPPRAGHRGGGSPDRRGLAPRKAVGARDEKEGRSLVPRHSPLAPTNELLFGRNAVLEALRVGRPIRRLLLAAGAGGEAIAQVVDAARARGVRIDTADRQRLDALASHHQGVIVEAAPFRYAELEDLLARARAGSEAPLILALDTLQDPQNFGSLLRTAAAVGAHGAVIPEHRAVGVTPAVAKAAAGATEHLAIARVTNLARALGTLKAAGLWVMGLDARADTPYVQADLSGPLVVVVGGEASGVRPLVRQTCDFLVRLPMPGRIESLNAAVAGSIALYEVLRQRSRQGKPWRGGLSSASSPSGGQAPAPRPGQGQG